MAAVDKRTLLRDAVRFVQKGQLDKAIDAYRAIAKADPKDSKVRNELGDLYIRQGRKKEAIAEYLETANLYEKDGFALRAIALCQKILNLDPELVQVRLKLADLYSGQRLAAEARAQYLQVANWHDKKGEVAGALEVFRRIADLEPDNLAVRVKLAGMFEKQKFPEKAAAEYARAAKGALAKGDATAAVQLFVRAYKLHPANADARRGIADFHRERKDWPVLVGLLQPLAAKGSRETDLLVLYAEALTHVNHPKEAAAVLEKVREREPNSVPVNLALGRALLKAGEPQEGIAALNRCVGAHLAENRLDLADALLREMAAAAPEDDRIQQRVLEVAQKRGDRDAVADTYLRLAGIYEAKGLGRNAAGALEKYLEARPGDAAAAARLEGLREHAPPRPAPPPLPPAPPPEPEPAEAEAEEAEDVDAIEIDLEGEDLAGVEVEGEEAEDLELVVEGEAEAAATPVEPTTVAEAAAAIASGAAGKAAAFLESWLEEHPGDGEAARLLCEARREQGGGAPLRDAYLRLAAICRRAGSLEEARLACQDALAADPRSSAAALTLAQIVVEEERRAKAAEAPAPPAVEEEVHLEPPPVETGFAAPLPAEEEPSLREPAAEPAGAPPLAEAEEEIDLEAPGIGDAAAESLGAVEGGEGLQEAEPGPESLGEPAPEAAAPLAPAPPEAAPSPEFWSELLEPEGAAPAAPAGAARIGDDLSLLDVVEEEAPALPESAGAAPPAAPESAIPEAPAAVGVPASARGSEEGELEEFLAEADFYFQQGLLDEAELLYRKLLKLAPGSAEIAGQIRRLEAARRESAAAPVAGTPGPEAAAEAAPAAAAASGGGLGGGDFSDFLSDLRQEFESTIVQAAGPAEERAAGPEGEQGLTEIFQEFQRNVREQLGEGDFETHYNLGIAYKEMGLMDEALGEFGLAERSPTRRADALSMVALCLRGMGRLDEAAAKLAAGIGEVAEGSEQQKGFLYDLAAVHEAAGRPAEALDALRRLVAIDPSYRDAAARLRRHEPPPAARKKPRVGYL